MTAGFGDEVTQCLLCRATPSAVAAILADAASNWIADVCHEMTAHWSATAGGRRGDRHNRLVVEFLAAPGEPHRRLIGDLAVSSLPGETSMLTLRGRFLPYRPRSAMEPGLPNELAEKALRAIVGALETATSVESRADAGSAYP